MTAQSLDGLSFPEARRRVVAVLDTLGITPRSEPVAPYVCPKCDEQVCVCWIYDEATS
jgi:hypothetical protein